MSRERGRFRYNIAAMARYRIIQWRDLPSLVEATDGDHTVRIPLSQRFQDLIDALRQVIYGDVEANAPGL